MSMSRSLMPIGLENDGRKANEAVVRLLKRLSVLARTNERQMLSAIPNTAERLQNDIDAYYRKKLSIYELCTRIDHILPAE